MDNDTICTILFVGLGLWDHTHAVIMAGVYVIVKAIRSDKTVVRVIGNAEPGNWEASIVKGAGHDR
jgi:hypothetical protein